MDKMFLSLALYTIICSCGSNGLKVNAIAPIDDSTRYIQQCIEFIKEVKEQELEQEDFILADKPFAFQYFDCLDEIYKDTSTFTKAELTYIKDKKYPSISEWKEGYFEDIRLLNNDTIDNIFKDNSRGWQYFYNEIGKRYYTFSTPIFLRNGEYCLFYSDHFCGWLCAAGELILYKKEKGRWKDIKRYCTWIS